MGGGLSRNKGSVCKTRPDSRYRDPTAITLKRKEGRKKGCLENRYAMEILLSACFLLLLRDVTWL